jgi:hypothetical protein
MLPLRLPGTTAGQRSIRTTSSPTVLNGITLVLMPTEKKEQSSNKNSSVLVRGALRVVGEARLG